jgi:hypothetical protein
MTCLATGLRFFAIEFRAAESELIAPHRLYPAPLVSRHPSADLP